MSSSDIPRAMQLAIQIKEINNVIVLNKSKLYEIRREVEKMSQADWEAICDVNGHTIYTNDHMMSSDAGDMNLCIYCGKEGRKCGYKLISRYP